MNWNKILFVLIIVMLYIPMVFLGANVFFPKYTGSDAYYQYLPGKDCSIRYPPLDEKSSADARAQRQAEIDACYEVQQAEQRAFEKEKNDYDGNKYTFIVIFNLVILLLAIFWTTLNDTIMMGIFLGPVLTTFIATMSYFQTNSKIGFTVLVITFFTSLWFINRKRALFFSWATLTKK